MTDAILVTRQAMEDIDEEIEGIKRLIQEHEVQIARYEARLKILRPRWHAMSELLGEQIGGGS